MQPASQPSWTRGILRSCSRGLAATLLLSIPIGTGAAATELVSLPGDLTELSLDDLMAIEVTSVSKRPQPVAQAAAAIFVLSGEEIRRSGARTIADALRLVPGLQVARTSAHAYAVSARGFNTTSADKLEIVMDGRSLYTPLFSGVFWDVVDTHLPDIERIEVIRGPGATLWGANAVNGVINIVTKSAEETQGSQWVGGGGNEERAFGSLRSGGAVGENGALRIYAKGYERDRSKRPNGDDASDGARQARTGFRSDWALGGGGLDPARDQLTVSGDFYDGRERAARVGGSPGQTDTTTVTGTNLLSRWSRRSGEDAEISVQVFYDHAHRLIPRVFEETRDTVDLDAQHRLTLGQRHQVVYGAGYRNSQDRTGGPPLAIIFDPAQRRLETYSAFAQDQISLAGGAGQLTLGSKFEHNDFTGAEVQPNLRLGWLLRERLFTWGSVARAVRTPNRIDSDVAVFCSAQLAAQGLCAPANSTFRIGNPELEAETLLAYEWGLRAWTENKFSADLALFYNDYDDLRSSETNPPFGSFANTLKGTGYGAELSATWRRDERLSLRGFYSYLLLDIQKKPGSQDANSDANKEGADPRHQLGLGLTWEPAPRWTVDAFLRYVDTLTFYSSTRQAQRVPGYAELDLRTGWRPLPRFELALIGRDLLHETHPEFSAEASRNELQRSALLELNWEWD